jgi:hypothetical protein
MALGYRKAAAPPASDVMVSVWTSGSGDYLSRTGAATSESTSWTGIGGADVVKVGVFHRSDALVIGGLGSDTFTQSSTAVGAKTKATTPGVGTYVAYIDGAFSTDFAYTANFTDADTTMAGVASYVRAKSYGFTANVNYRVVLPDKWWFEPTVGLNYTLTDFNTSGVEDAEVWVVQGGARLGTEFRGPDGIKIQPTFGAYIFSDVSVKPGGPPVPLIPIANDEGKVWGKGTAKLNFQFTDKVSAAIEGEVRGTEDAVGYAGRLSARLSF